MSVSRGFLAFLQFYLVIAFAVCGCSTDPTGLGTLSAVTGEVNYKGEPTPGAIVELVSKDALVDRKPGTIALDAPRAFGVVQDDGTFEVQTTVPEGLKKGVLPGEYLISITWTKLDDPYDNDSSRGPDLLPAKYKDPSKSTLEFEVVAGRNQIPPFNIEP